MAASETLELRECVAIGGSAQARMRGLFMLSAWRAAMNLRDIVEKLGKALGVTCHHHKSEAEWLRNMRALGIVA